MSDSHLETETLRVQAEYRERDAAGLSRVYDYLNPAFLYHMQERERAILSILSRQDVSLSEAHVLEVGCGTGHILERFIEFGASKVHGIDLMGQRLKTGKDRYPTISFVEGNGAKLPFKNSSFDIVMQFMCLSSVLDDSVTKLIADEMLRVLKPGGLVLYYDLRPPSVALRIVLKILRTTRRSRGEAPQDRTGETPGTEHVTPIRPLTAKAVRSLFGTHSFPLLPVSLDFTIAGIARRSHLSASLLSYLPWFRSHYIGLLRKN